jgi:hypothetical protein
MTATVTVRTAKTTHARRAQLIRLARKADQKVEARCAEFHAACTEIGTYDADYVRFMAGEMQRAMNRYDKLVDALARETGLPHYSVRNDLSVAFPFVPRLMNANL